MKETNQRPMLCSGMLVKHFKRELLTDEELRQEPNKYLYKIVGTARHTETGEELMIYTPLYNTDCVSDVNYVARPLKMFYSEVDHTKYPNIKQRYRFEELK